MSQKSIVSGFDMELATERANEAAKHCAKFFHLKPECITIEIHAYEDGDCQVRAQSSFTRDDGSVVREVCSYSCLSTGYDYQKHDGFTFIVEHLPEGHEAGGFNQHIIKDFPNGLE